MHHNSRWVHVCHVTIAKEPTWDHTMNHLLILLMPRMSTCTCRMSIDPIRRLVAILLYNSLRIRREFKRPNTQPTEHQLQPHLEHIGLGRSGYCSES